MRVLEKPAAQRRCFLLPQHFEQRDQYLEALLDEWLGVLSPFAWGLAQLSIDAVALSEGVLRVISVIARFPSGELAFLRAGDSPLEVAFPAETLAERPLDVFLGLPDWSSEGPNAGEDGAPETATRYRSVAAQPQGRGPTLRPRLRLYVDGEDLPADRIRLARVRSTRGDIEIDPDVLPPTLWPLPGTFLPSAIAAIVGALSARQAQLLAARRERPHEPLTFSAEQVPQLLALSTVQQALAALTNPVSRRGAHPRETHRVLSELLGAIEALEGQIAPVPSYIHEAAGPGFSILASRLLAAIPVFARPPHDALPFVRRDVHTFVLKLPDPALLRRRVHLVLIGAERAHLEHGAPSYGKLASEASMPQIVQTAVRGIELAPDFDPPASLPSSAQSACFNLNTRSAYWADVLERGSLVFYLPNAPQGLRVALYVTNDRERAS